MGIPNYHKIRELEIDLGFEPSEMPSYGGAGTLSLGTVNQILKEVWTTPIADQLNADKYFLYDEPK